jgi:hypothetical protein
MYITQPVSYACLLYLFKMVYISVVTVCTTCFKIKKILRSADRVHVFLKILTINSRNRLVFVMGTLCFL